MSDIGKVNREFRVIRREPGRSGGNENQGSLGGEISREDGRHGETDY